MIKLPNLKQIICQKPLITTDIHNGLIPLTNQGQLPQKVIFEMLICASS